MVVPRIVVKSALAFSVSRALLNAAYRKLTPKQKRMFHRAFAKIYRDHRDHRVGGIWKIEFGGREIQMPLAPESLWLDWDSAVSIVGHDIEITETYKEFIGSPHEPEVFLDVGANYGTHSLLFLTHGIRTITFEPNGSCKSQFMKVCAANGLEPQLEHVALGDGPGFIELSYPEDETWLGSTNAMAQQSLATHHRLIKERVIQKTLDDYLDEMSPGRTLIKIDTEGSELAVLRGASRTLSEVRPHLIFESGAGSERSALASYLAGYNYRIHRLPWAPDAKSHPIEVDEFCSSPMTNFIAVPGKGS